MVASRSGFGVIQAPTGSNWISLGFLPPTAGWVWSHSYFWHNCKLWCLWRETEGYTLQRAWPGWNTADDRWWGQMKFAGGDNTVEAELGDGSGCTALPHHTEHIFKRAWVGCGVKESRWGSVTGALSLSDPDEVISQDPQVASHTHTQTQTHSQSQQGVDRPAHQASLKLTAKQAGGHLQQHLGQITHNGTWQEGQLAQCKPGYCCRGHKSGRAHRNADAH